MSPRAWRERIRNILDAVAEITVFTHGIAFDAFRYDAKTIRAVERGTAVTRQNVWVSSFNGKILVMDMQGRPVASDGGRRSSGPQ